MWRQGRNKVSELPKENRCARGRYYQLACLHPQPCPHPLPTHVTFHHVTSFWSLSHKQKTADLGFWEGIQFTHKNRTGSINVLFPPTLALASYLECGSDAWKCILRLWGNKQKSHDETVKQRVIRCLYQPGTTHLLISYDVRKITLCLLEPAYVGCYLQPKAFLTDAGAVVTHRI